jgi:seryl-tRNA synthetase
MNTVVALERETQQEFLSQLIDCKLFIPSGEPGVYGRGMEFERVRTAVDCLITSISAPDCPETPRFPPIIAKRTLERAGYLKSFPNLCGAVFSFTGKESAALDLLERADRGDDWGVHLSMTEVALTPAACYPAYPAVARRGPLPPGGILLDLGGSYVFRNEPSPDPARLQVFHQREMVRMGDADDVLQWRELWMSRAISIFQRLGLDAKLDLASDPFFGRAGKLLASSQRAQSLKFEVLVPIASTEPTAVASFNYHQEHFGSAFGIQLHDGSVANTACLGFGLERITLALFRKHGLDTNAWSSDVKDQLGYWL